MLHYFWKKWTYYYPITATDISNGPKNTNFHVFRISFMFLTHKFLSHKIGMPSHSKSNNFKLNNLKTTFFRPKIADLFNFCGKSWIISTFAEKSWITPTFQEKSWTHSISSEIFQFPYGIFRINAQNCTVKQQQCFEINAGYFKMIVATCDLQSRPSYSINCAFLVLIPCNFDSIQCFVHEKCMQNMKSRPIVSQHSQFWKINTLQIRVPREWKIFIRIIGA